jgi:hypothetical protein
MLQMISYDLAQPGRNYATLSAALERIGAKRVLFSQWLLATHSSPAQVRDYLVTSGGLDSNDRLLVVEVKRNAAWTGLLLPGNAVAQEFEKAA